MSEDTDLPEPSTGSGRELAPVADVPPPPADDESADPDDDQIESDATRVDEDAKERVLGSQYERQKYSRNRATGHSMWGNNNTQNIYSARMVTVFRRPRHIDELADCYAPTEEKEEKALREALDRRTSVCLSGEAETGRFSTACKALVERFGTDRVEEIIPPPDRSPAEAVHDITAEDLIPGSGYLLRIEDGDPAPFISRLDALMHANHGQLVLIRNARPGTALRGDTEIRHQPPHPHEVFRAHIQRLSKHSARDLTGHLKLADTVPLPVKPRDVVWLAGEAAGYDVIEAERVLREHDVWKLRERAGDILGAQEDKGATARRRLPQHRRAFRLVYAAMAGQPVGHVFDGTGRLLTKLDAESGWENLGRTALEHPVSALLGTDLTADWKSPDNPNRLARVDDGLARAIFDVAWHEFDHTRPALLAWLHSLAEEGDEAFREAAVRAAVTLALLDFDGIWPTLVDQWSRSAKTRVRLAAVKVALYLGSANRVGHVVARRVHRWARGTTYQRDTAARAYAGGLLLSDTSWILADLRRTAEDPKQKTEWTIATAVGRLAAPELLPDVVATLAQWVREDGPTRVITRHAARSFVTIMLLPDETGDDAHPALLLALTHGRIRRSDLTQLWYAALLGVSTRHGAWNGLLMWLRHADRDHALRPHVADMLHDMATAAALRRRLLHCLTRPDTPDWIAALLKEWTR